MIRGAFESGELDQITLVPCSINLVAALTRRSITHPTNLNKMFIHGYWIIDNAKVITHIA